MSPVNELNQIANMGDSGNIYVSRVIKYIATAAKINNRQEAVQVIKSGLSNLDGGEIMTTLAEHWKQEGIELGIEKGIEKGKLEGKLEALKLVAMNLFGQGLTVEQISSATGLPIKEVTSLKNSSTH